jgi:putative glutamine amidotransferase
MSYPVIGITTMRRVNQAGMPLSSVAEAYVEVLLEAGASPLLIPNALSKQALSDVYSRLDGVLFSGGGDIEPGAFRGENHPTVNGVEVDRDQLEIHLLQKLVEDGKPLLGICRGLQLVNVALGGSLFTDIADLVPGAAKHDYYPGWERDYLAHSIQVVDGTQLAGILGEQVIRVNSFHHQAVRELGAGLIPTAYSPDGILEGIELIDHPFALAVQWHPEWLTAQQPMRALFKAFVRAAESF